MQATVLEKTIRSDKGFERVSLSVGEMNEVNDFVLDYNVAVVGQCLRRAQDEFAELEPDRRHQVALLLADKLALHLFTAHKAALSAKVAAIKDAARNAGGENDD